ncbi:MAG: PRD domain-containing protein [Traorella sp.]
MKLLKKINNNYALALDSNGEQVIVEGKGIGFQKMPCECHDLSCIAKTYYNTQSQSLELIQSISEEILSISSKIYTYAEESIVEKINPNLTFILADHIEFAIERYKKNIIFKLPLYYDIKQLFPIEMKIAEYAVDLINEELGIKLPNSEKVAIAMNIINSETEIGDKNSSEEELFNLITEYIENSFEISIDRDSFSYSRFISHLEYLIKRSKEKKTASQENIELYKNIKQALPQISQCVNGLQIIFKQQGYYLNEEEKLYLMMHINRLCKRETVTEKA